MTVNVERLDTRTSRSSLCACVRRSPGALSSLRRQPLIRNILDAIPDKAVSTHRDASKAK